MSRGAGFQPSRVVCDPKNVLRKVGRHWWLFGINNFCTPDTSDTFVFSPSVCITVASAITDLFRKECRQRR